MQILIKQKTIDEYVLSFDDTEVTATRGDLNELLLAVTSALMIDPDRRANEQTRQFVDRLKTANDVGIQSLLRMVDQDDILVLLKYSEGNEALLGKIYGNMSERSRKIFAEDLIYKFKNDVPPAQVNAAVSQLVAVAERLEEDGNLEYGVR